MNYKREIDLLLSIQNFSKRLKRRCIAYKDELGRGRFPSDTVAWKIMVEFDEKAKVLMDQLIQEEKAFIKDHPKIQEVKREPKKYRIKKS